MNQSATAQKANDTLLGWHFVSEDGKERWGSHRRIQAGKTYRVRGKIVLCEYGLHASKRAIDALRYAPGPIACRVQLSGRILRDTDKAVATQRTVLAMADATNLLHEFACWCAERALRAERKAGREPNKRSWEAIHVKRRWLKGKASDEELGAARATRAAGAAAKDAWAAWAARDARAAGAAAWATQNRKLERMLKELLG